MLPLPDADIQLIPDFLTPAQADDLLQQLKTTIHWEQRSIKMFGKVLPQPRLTAWYGDPDARYTYSGLTWEPLPWTDALTSVKTQLETATQLSFNSVLLNLYRNGQDSMGWHSDDEPELGKNPAIASLSLGATRRFHLQHRSNKTLKHPLDLTHGSLLLMQGPTQHHWRHQLPKSKRVTEPRINLTFRTVHPA